MKTLDYGNGLDIANTFTQDYEIDVLGVYDGVTAIISRTHGRTDNLNLTGITDGVTAADSQTFAYSPSNRLQDADGPWGDLDATYDGVGNRLTRALTQRRHHHGHPDLRLSGGLKPDRRRDHRRGHHPHLHP